MPTISDQNFAYQQVDCAVYSGDLIFERCNLAQNTPDTAQTAIFINVGAITSITINDSNCTNHRQPPQPGVTYVNCNVTQFAYSSVQKVGNVVNISPLLEAELQRWWIESADYFVANPTATYGEYTIWWDANMATGPFNQDTFLAMVQAELNTIFGDIATYQKFRDWCVNHRDDIDFESVVL